MRAATVLALLVMVSVFSLVGCSPDIEEDEVMEDEVMATEEQASSSLDWWPHWMDGTITVRTGVYETGKEMGEAIDSRKNFHAYGVALRMAIIKIPMSKIPGETEVTVMTLREAGMTGTPTTEEIREHFRKKGYGPLTLEEAVMTRLDFADQPRKTETSNKKMVEFLALLSQEDGLSIGWRGNERTFRIVRYAGWDLIGQGNIIAFFQATEDNINLETAFACVKILP